MGTQFDETAVFKGECGPCAVFALYPGIHLTGEEKSGKTIDQGSREVPNWRALGRILCVDLPTILLGTSSGLLTLITDIHFSVTALGRWDMSPVWWRSSLACESWPRWTYFPRRGPNRQGAMAQEWCWLNRLNRTGTAIPSCSNPTLIYDVAYSGLVTVRERVVKEWQATGRWSVNQICRPWKQTNGCLLQDCRSERERTRGESVEWCPEQSVKQEKVIRHGW